MIHLTPLARDAVAEIAHLAPLPEQEQFAGTAAAITADPRPMVDFHVIRQDGLPVGVFKIDRDYEDGRHFAPPGAWGLRGFMIDAGHQGRGVAGAALRALPPYLRSRYPGLTEVWLTVNERNPAARSVYLKGGWVDTGRMYPGGKAGPQHILQLKL